MNCAKLEKFLEEWLDATAPPELNRHVEDCPQCSRRAAELRKTGAWMSLLRQEPPELSPGFWVRFWREQQKQTPADLWTALTAVARPAVAALALVVVLFLLGVWSLPQGTDPALTEFDSPQTYWAEVAGVRIPENGGPTRDEVVLTLVSRAEVSQ